MNEQRAWALCAAVVACYAGVRLEAQPQGPQLTPNYRDADIRMVADQVQQVIGRPIIVDPRVRAQVTVLSNAPMSPDAFYRLFLSTLEVHGYQALDSGGGAIAIVPDANARFGAGDNYITQAIVLDNIGAPNLVATLRPLLPQSAHLASHQSSNALIIADTPANVRRMIELVRRIDVAGTQEVEVISLENASADEVVRILSALNQAGQAAGGAPAIQVIADLRTNSVLLSGAGQVRLEMRALIAHLDTPSAQGGDSLVHYLNYADAEDLATKLQAQFSGGGGAQPTPEGGAAVNAGPITIWADAGTNALVLNAPERIREDMLAIINQIDIPRYQVQVDAIIVELSEEKAAQIGVTWLSANDQGDSVLGVTNFGNAGGGGILGLAGSAAGDTPNLSAIAEGITVGVGKITDGGTSWAALLNALRGDGETNIVSTPQIVTLDNEEAEISVGQEVPFLSGQFTNTGANQGSVNPFQTIQREPVGTRLKITPQINEGSGMKLVIEQETSSLSTSVQGAADLVTNTRTIKTTVFVNDGEVLVLGGLIDDQLRESDRRVPGLSRIPGLGWLFRSRKADRKKTNLMVFIRPTILRDAADARFQTNAKYRYIQDLQRQMSEGGVRLMRGDEAPTLPPLPEPPPEPESRVPPAADGNQPR